MTIVSVTTFKAHRSRYPNLVRTGREFVVTSHGPPVGRLLFPTALTMQMIKPIRPVMDGLQIIGVHRRRETPAVEVLLAGRRRR